MDNPVIILGGGGHAKVCIDLLIRQNREIIGYTAPKPEGVLPGNVPYLGEDSVVLSYKQEDISLVNGIGMIGTSQLRSTIYKQFSSQKFSFATLTHDSAIVSQFAEIQEGVQIMAGAIVQAGSVVAINTIINTRAVIDHDCRIGAHSHISPGAVLCGQVVVGEQTQIGAGATVIQNVKIGHSAVVGAGALVRNPVANQTVVYGVPAEEAIR